MDGTVQDGQDGKPYPPVSEDSGTWMWQILTVIEMFCLKVDSTQKIEHNCHSYHSYS
jgi:hypothetical protein